MANGGKIKRKKYQSISNFVQLSIYLKVLTDKHIAINLVKWSIKKKKKTKYILARSRHLYN